ncbi:MAG: 4Fe-4S binding protein [candidate division WOR-3 bacterium]|nr:4Fe-4S binding protein [candidate division WOR-3 bacterium]
MSSVRKIIRIDEEKCTGCGRCIPNCPEGALQIIDGKARLVSELFCDGLGACVGTCPEGALTIEERPAEPYDENRVMANIVRCGSNTITAHLRHLKEHGAQLYYEQAVTYLREHNIPIPEDNLPPLPCGCPGTQVRRIENSSEENSNQLPIRHSRLTNWPIKLMLVPVNAPYLSQSNLLIAADCTGFALPDLHERFLKNRILLIGCPKLDDARFYQEKLTRIFQENDIRSVTILHMEVPCCFGLVQLVRNAIMASSRNINFQEITINIDGQIKE